VSARAAPRFTSLVIAATALWLISSPASAEFILDDFVDPVSISLPDERNILFETDNVGPLSALRLMRGSAFDARPVGGLDANISTPSVWTTTIGHLNPVSSTAHPHADIKSAHFFEATDFTENGTNNAFFLDFLTLESQLPPPFLHVIVKDVRTSDPYISRFWEVPLSSEPFTLVVPFETFQPQYSSAFPRPDFRTIRRVEFGITAVSIHSDAPEPLNFRVELDAIRVGTHPVPEVAAGTLWLITLGLLAGSLGRSAFCFSFSRTKGVERWNRDSLW
jgi:hypothetical protein